MDSRNVRSLRTVRTIAAETHTDERFVRSVLRASQIIPLGLADNVAIFKDDATQAVLEALETNKKRACDGE